VRNYFDDQNVGVIAVLVNDPRELILVTGSSFLMVECYCRHRNVAEYEFVSSRVSAQLILSLEQLALFEGREVVVNEFVSTIDGSAGAHIIAFHSQGEIAAPRNRKRKTLLAFYRNSHVRGRGRATGHHR